MTTNSVTSQTSTENSTLNTSITDRSSLAGWVILIVVVSLVSLIAIISIAFLLLTLHMRRKGSSSFLKFQVKPQGGNHVCACMCLLVVSVEGYKANINNLRRIPITIIY